MTVWHLKKGSEKKFRFGHPWVFSSELAQSPKGIEPGALVELRDAQGSFLARGYGHPNSMISFRILTQHQSDQIDAGFFLERLERAAGLRRLAGLERFSHRLCFAEGDGIPGLIVDRYILETEDSTPNSSPAQVFVVQSSTAGIDGQLPLVCEALELLTRGEQKRNSALASWDATSIVIANDAKSRAMEGIAVEPKSVLRQGAGFTHPEKARLVVQPSLGDLDPLIFTADLITGQKTGFFLDQRFNVHIAARFINQLAADRRELRVLDLCCYIGQWGAQISHLAKARGSHAQVTCVDASQKALELAAQNVISHGGSAKIEKADVLTGMDRLATGGFDVVICDPPAFIKKKKDLPNGSQAYFKMNREAIRKTARGGIFVSCSCSGLFSEEDFRSMLARVSATSFVEMRWLARGGHSPDHPQRPEFPQGTYLKSWLGINC